MKKQNKSLIILLLVLILISISSQKIYASNTNLFQKTEYSEEFKKWLELSDEEKENSIIPRMYEIENTKSVSKNPLNIARMLKASNSTRYSLKNIIPANLAIKNQQQTNSCWAFAALSSLETNLALSNYKSGNNLSKIYDFSERHMEYATSKAFNNNAENKIGYNRKVGSGGSFLFASSYLTNGSGAISESEMPFENNEDTIDISQIQNKTVSSQVYDTVAFPDYSKENDENKAEIMNQIKQHIQNYGSVQASIHGNSSSLSAYNCYNNDTGAKFCKNSIMHKIDHAVSIIGWDDNYSIDNFPENAKPTSNGAWIVRNSWGEKAEDWKLSELKEEIFNTYKQQCISKGWNSAEEIPDEFIKQAGYTIENGNAYIKYGDNGIIYISYEDVNISKEIFGIIKATDTVNYDYIYQYDEFFPAMQLTLNNPSMMLSNIFNKKSSGTEYLTQISLYAPETYTCKVYVNTNGTSRAKNDLQLVTLKAGESETFNAGYHTLEFSKPIEIKANSFAVVVEIQGSKNSLKLPLESKVSGVSAWDSVTVENGKCFVAIGNDLEKCEWIDLSKMTEQNSSLVNGDSTIKAFTTTELIDESLKSVEIATPPTKTSYFEGENFDKTGMVVKANYNSKTNPSTILDGSSYNIKNGTNLKEGQTSVTITYKDKSVNQKITVEKNSVVGLKIKTPPTKTSYFEGQKFDKTGMVVEANYKDGTTKEISDYTIIDGNTLKANQKQVTISYGEKTITQDITVTPNALIEIKVTKAPNKTKYIVGQDFDKTGMVITGTYQDKSTQEILDYTIENGKNLTKGQTSITIKYEEKTTTQSITVEEKTITGISISKAPSKTQYIQNKESLDLTGGILKIKYNDNTSEEIELTSEKIKNSGFDNKKIGKNNITITYQSFTTTLEVEIISEQVAENSNLDKAICNINSAKFYTFSNKDIQEYAIIDVTINEITRNTKNDSCEYYYYLSSNQDESNIQNWVKINENQTDNEKLTFTINTKDMKNYSEIYDAQTVYIYIKEVAKKGGNQAVLMSKSIEMKANVLGEVYLDNVKINNSNSGNSNNSGTSNKDEDKTIAQNKLPHAGVRNIMIFVSIILVIGIIFYARYKNLSKYIK